LRLALIGFGNVGRAFARLVDSRQTRYPFRIVGIHTARHGTAYDPSGLPVQPDFGPAAESIDEFLDRAESDAVVEITTLNPETGEPALSYIRAAFARRRHVVTANKGPVAHAYADLASAAARAGVQFRFESTVMDGAPVFNLVRRTLPAARVLGFTGVLNSTSKVVIAAMREGKTKQEGIDIAIRLGITEANPSYDLDGWDSAAKTAALANVLLDARTTPQQVEREGIGSFPEERVRDLAAAGKTVCLVSRGEKSTNGIRLTVRPEILGQTDLLAAVQNTSNLLLLHTDLMGTVGTVSIEPGVDQTAYGLFSDLVDIIETISLPRL
jgi:homoserine dehydrogenase